MADRILIPKALRGATGSSRIYTAIGVLVGVYGAIDVQLQFLLPKYAPWIGLAGLALAAFNERVQGGLSVATEQAEQAIGKDLDSDGEPPSATTEKVKVDSQA